MCIDVCIRETYVRRNFHINYESFLNSIIYAFQTNRKKHQRATYMAGKQPVCNSTSGRLAGAHIPRRTKQRMKNKKKHQREKNIKYKVRSFCYSFFITFELCARTSALYIILLFLVFVHVSVPYCTRSAFSMYICAVGIVTDHTRIQWKQETGKNKVLAKKLLHICIQTKDKSYILLYRKSC